MTPRPGPCSPRGTSSGSSSQAFERGSEEGGELGVEELFLLGGRRGDVPRRAPTVSSSSSSSDEGDNDVEDVEQGEDRRIDRDLPPQPLAPRAAPFSTVHHRRPQQSQQQQKQHDYDEGKQHDRGKKKPLPPSFSLSIPVSRSSSSSSSSTSLSSSLLPRAASLTDLEEGAVAKPQLQERQALLLRHRESSASTSTSKTRGYLRRRRRLRSFASFAPPSLLRLRGGLGLRRRPQTASHEPWAILPPTVVIPLLNGIDMFAVSLVIPLLFQYYKSAGVTSAGHRELLSSVFSMSQIVGGLMIGVLTDAHLVERKTILLLSFGGSAVSYALIAFGGLNTILLSRVLVGLVKHTMTVCTTILTHHTTKENRARGLGRLTASSTVAWVVGPTLGALLYRYVDPRAPVLLACLLFVLDFVLAWVLVDHDPKPTDSAGAPGGDTTNAKDPSAAGKLSKSKLGLIIRNLKCCFGSRALGSAVATKLLLTWINRATNYSQLGSFYEDMYNLQPHHRGYISSYQQLVQLAANVRLISPVLEWAGGERRATLYCVAITAAAVWLESLRSLPLFLGVLCPVIAFAYSISEVSVQTLVTHVAPPSGMFSVLAALDVLQSAASVSVPFYRTWLFRQLPRDASEGAMEGDPDPVAWVLASSLHWLLAAVVLSFALTRESWWVEDHPHHPSKAPAKKGK